MLPIERSSFILLAQQPAADWLNALPHDEHDKESGEEVGKIDVGMLNAQPPVFLVDFFESPEAMDEQFQKIWPKLWETWLAGFNPEPSSWPQKREMENFGQWFQVLPTPMVYDALTAGPGEIETAPSGIIMP